MFSNPRRDEQDVESGGRLVAADEDQLVHPGAARDARYLGADRRTDGKVSQ